MAAPGSQECESGPQCVVRRRRSADTRSRS